MGHENDRYLPGAEFMPGISAGANTEGVGSAGAMRPSPPPEDLSGSPYVGMGSTPTTDIAIESYQQTVTLPAGMDTTGAGKGTTMIRNPEAGD